MIRMTLLKKTVAELVHDNVTTHSAALAFFTILSIAPLLIISIAIAGFIFGEQATRGDIFVAIQDLVGPSGAKAIEGMVRSAGNDHHSGVVATCAGLITLLFGASGAFSQLEDSLNLIWKVETLPGKSFLHFIRQRLLSFSMVLVIGFLLLVSLVASAALSAMGSFVGSRLPGGEAVWHVVNFVFSFAIITLLFAAIFKILPDVRIAWREVWLGAAVTAFLFDLGKLAIGAYLGKSSIASAYGAAGSVVIILLWTYYSSIILFFGAEFTRAHSEMHGKNVEPKEGTRFIEPAA
jgi:membrane protein